MGSFPSANPSLPTSIPGIYEPPGAPATGSHALGVGSGAGNYTSSSSAFVAIDAANLSFSVVVPVGSVLWAVLCATMIPNPTHTSRIGIAVDGLVVAAQAVGGSSFNVPVSAQALVVGDGASHTIQAQYQTDSGGTVSVDNSLSEKVLATLVILSVPA